MLSLSIRTSSHVKSNYALTTIKHSHLAHIPSTYAWTSVMALC